MDYIQKICDKIKQSNETHIKLDIGLSYNAPQSQNWLENDSNLLVVGFEPNPECIESINNKQIIKKHHLHGKPIEDKYIGTKFFLIPFALANVNKIEMLDFYKMTNDVGTSSLFKPIDKNLGPIKEIIQVPVISLKLFFDNFPWNKFEIIEYIKIDAQGADYNILLGAGDYLKERVVYITAEPESSAYIGSYNNTTNNMIIYLKSQGFEQIQHPNTSDPTFINTKFIHLKDKIYIRQLG